MVKIAIVGSGVSGLTAGHLLSQEHEVHLFEANDALGGHTATIDVEVASGKYAIDTGFIVFNDWTYPNFIELMKQLKVASKPSDMSFSVKSEISGLEYNGTDLNRLFAQRSNLFKPSFYRMIREILRFNRESPAVLDAPEASRLTLGEFLKNGNYAREFIRDYIIPMGAAIWSANEKQMLDFPARYFVQFFKNHGMISVNERPQWHVIQNGSRSYLAPITRRFQDRIRLMSSVQSAKKTAKGVSLELSSGELFEADHVILACHSDQSLRILGDRAEYAEHRELLSHFAYQSNDVVLHTDHSVLPKRRLAWAAWNYLIPIKLQSKVSVTYDMNILQGFESPETFCVSLNMTDRIEPGKILRKFVYDHPVYTTKTVDAQKRWASASGKNGVHLAGAYWGYGFHEDGVKSALNVCERFGVKLTP